VKSINLQTEFLQQFWKQQEDSPILLASNRPQQQQQEQNRPTERGRKRRIGNDYNKEWDISDLTKEPATGKKRRLCPKEREWA